MTNNSKEVNVITANKWGSKFRAVLTFWSALNGSRFDTTEDEKTRALIELPTLLGATEIGSELYDMFVLKLYNNQENEKLFMELLEAFVNKFDYMKFVYTARHFLLNAGLRENLVNSLFMTLINFIMIGYNRGNLMGIYKRSPLFDEYITLMDYDIKLIVALNDKVKSRRMLDSSIKLSPKMMLKMKSYLASVDKFNQLKVIDTGNVNDLLELLNKSMNSLRYIYSTNIYVEQNDNCVLDNAWLSANNWERENLETNPSNIFGLLSVYRNIYDADDMLRKRKIYVREKGVTLRFNKQFDNIESITIKEYHNFEPYEEHYLFVNYVHKGISRFLTLDMATLDSSQKTFLYEIDVSAVLLVFSWLGLAADLDLSYDNFKRGFNGLNNYDELSQSDKEDLVKTHADIVNAFKLIDSYLQEDNFFYEQPYHWNHFNEGSSKTSSGTPIYAQEARKIGRYTRRVPAGSTVSEEAKQLAKRLFIDLKEGYTIVDEFERKQRVRLNK